ncbi:hypothetical protein skT53_33550 [Effusibacillus dendaii]|uniref:YtkA-like domain-containing protein n=1 Tax=Effusibacillus dendaii TaxID=2743772 RepID=A0A7I8DI87_9BACL|nr:hypothetical protein skT53_33550 [Effusibacillus dendaii]
MLEATKGASGEYYVKHVFSDAGTYHVMYHVTARDQHSMKDMKIDVVK